ncbi:MAG: LptF/LptG family permease [Longimicrobiales bacterium]|nr:LptF/LptG family permease [Longimicrobiales bacterium]
MIRRLDRYVFGTFTRLFVLTMLAVAPLFMLGDLTDNIDDYLAREQVGVREVVLGYLYSLPQWLQWSLPIASLVAAVFTVNRMTVHHEVLAAKAGGVSFYRLFAPVLVVGVIVTGVGLVVADWIPRTNRVATDLLQNRRTYGMFLNDFSFRTESGMLLSARRLNVAEGKLARATLTGNAKGGRIHIDAATGDFTPLAGWVFHDGRLRWVSDDGRETTQQFRRMRVPALTEHPRDFLSIELEAEEMTRAEIDRQVGIIERSGGEPHKLRVEAAHRASIPVATLVIILFGAPLATTSNRGGAAFGVGVALGSLILYIMILNTSSAMGSAGLIGPHVAAWVPNLIFLVLGLAFLTRVRT